MPGTAQTFGHGAAKARNDFIMSYEAICVGACSLFQDEALERLRLFERAEAGEVRLRRGSRWDAKRG